MPKDMMTETDGAGFEPATHQVVREDKKENNYRLKHIEAESGVKVTFYLTV